MCLFKNKKKKTPAQKQESNKKEPFQWLSGKKKELTIEEVTEIEEFFEDDF